jgi:cytochrome P450 family 130
MSAMETAMTTTLYEPTRADFATSLPEVYRTLRDEHPLYHDPLDRFYALSRFDDVIEASRDWETYSSEARVEARYAKPSVHMMDPPRQSALRSIVSRAFTPRRIARLEDRMREIANDLIDNLLRSERPDGAVDYAFLLPSLISGELIGIPDELVPVCRRLTDLNMRRLAPEDVAVASAGSDEIFTELLKLRRANPTDDLLSALLAAEVDGQRLTEDELLGFCWLLLIGGNDTTSNLISNGIELLGRHPQQRAELASDPTLLGGAVEEMLRIESPSQVQPRTATRSVELPYGVIPAGARVLLLWGAANRDDREFVDADRFDIHRKAARHLALGHGAHFCLGAAMARLEARVAFDEFLKRIPEYEIVGSPERLISTTFRGFETIPLSVPAA